jgi:hypothetical protein
VHPSSHLKAHFFELADHPRSLRLPPDDEGKRALEAAVLVVQF